MRFYKNIIRSFVDVPDHISMVIHSLEGCNFKCYGCFNYDTIVNVKKSKFYTEKDILSYIELNKYLFDCIVFSGGEFLLNDLDVICGFLKEVKHSFEGKIIINTNGSFPEKISHLLENNYIDGIHLDIKLPYHLLDTDIDKDIYIDVLGKEITIDMKQKLLDSIDIVVRNDNEYSQVRTIKYPILSKEYFDQIGEYVQKLNQRYNSNIKWYLNEYLEEE